MNTKKLKRDKKMTSKYEQSTNFKIRVLALFCKDCFGRKFCVCNFF